MKSNATAFFEVVGDIYSSLPPSFEPSLHAFAIEHLLEMSSEEVRALTNMLEYKGAFAIKVLAIFTEVYSAKEVQHRSYVSVLSESLELSQQSLTVTKPKVEKQKTRADTLTAELDVYKNRDAIHTANLEAFRDYGDTMSSNLTAINQELATLKTEYDELDDDFEKAYRMHRSQHPFCD